VTSSGRRVTQQDIARIAGVSQATVSLILNRRGDPSIRIAEQTRDRVMQVILRTGYGSDRIARRQPGHGRVLGVFTCEPTFPSGEDDFYHPVVAGIEEFAEEAHCDVLLLTSAGVVDGRRSMFSEPGQLRRADGCILMGGSYGRAELARMQVTGQPFVAVGRRDAGAPVSYVAVDYPAATADLVRRAAELGHRRLAYVGAGVGPESLRDRLRGFTQSVAAAGVDGQHVPVADRRPAEVLAELRGGGVTAVFAERHADGLALARLAEAQGLAVPADLSIVALGDPDGPAASPASRELTGFRVPRRELGRQATEVLYQLLDGADGPIQRTLACVPAAGGTLAERPATTAH
jgi:LacI family transcriptional regulator